MRRHARVSSVSARSILRLISLGVSVFALASCAVGDGASEGERIGRTQPAVGNGEFDTTDRFKNVAALVNINTSTTFCGGFLASRRFAVSASHCFIPTNKNPGPMNDTRGAPLQVVFAPDPDVVPANDPRRVPHTTTVSGAVKTQLNTFVDRGDNERARDVAIIRLDRPVTADIAVPVRPAGLTVPGCPHDFQGTLVGYGPRSLIGAQGVFERRNFATSDGWTIQTHDNGWQTYTNDGEIAASLVDYKGSLEGDSGSPLFFETFDRVCGVVSGHFPVLKFAFLPLPGFYLFERSSTPALDGSDNVQFLSDNLLDKFGRVIGEREGPDTDGDNVADVEDNCPSVPNRARRIATAMVLATFATTAPPHRTATNATLISRRRRRSSA